MNPPIDNLLKTIQREAVGLQVVGPSDEELLASFLATRDEQAFEALLRRYGPMVMGVCRRVLVDRAAAEDAFQATFLTFVLKSDRMKPNASVAGWLHRTALHTATRMLRTTRRARISEAAHARPNSVESALADGIGPLLDEELGRLPEKYRQAIVLCCILDRPLAEVGKSLGASTATVWRWVEKGRTMLRRRLERRGVALSASALATMLATDPVWSAGPAPSVAKMLLGPSTGIPERISDLAREAARGQPPRRLWWLGSLFAAAGTAVLVGVALSGPPKLEPAPKTVPTPVATVSAPVGQPLGELVGTVKSADGKPVPFAAVTALAKQFVTGEAGGSDRVVGTTTADANGHYRLAIPKYASPVAEDRRLKVRVTAPDGTAVAASELPFSGGPAPFDPVVAAPIVLRGRAIDARGEAVVGARVAVSRIGDASLDPSTDPLPKGWPTIVQSTADGSFAIPGLPARTDVKLAVEHDSHAFAAVVVPAARLGARVDIPLGPARMLSGLITADDTGEPLAYAKLVLMGPARPEGMVGRKARTGADGRFRIMLPEGDRYAVQVHPSEGPYLPVARVLEWRAGRTAATVEIAIPRGIRLRGQVVDEDRKPVAGALVQFLSRQSDNPKYLQNVLAGGAATVAADDEGHYSLVAPPGPGTLIVHGPSLEYRATAADFGMLLRGAASGRRVYVHAAVSLDVGAADAVPEPTVVLRRGRTIDAKAIQPDGTALAEGIAMCRHFAFPYSLGTPVPVPIRDGIFRVPGCEPGRVYRALLFDKAGRYGAAVDLACPEKPGEAVEVKLEAVAAAEVRFVNTAGKPHRGVPFQVMVQLPADAPVGTAQLDRPSDSLPGIWCDARFSASVAVDGQGRATIPGLLPGASYRFGTVKGGSWSWVEFEVESGTIRRLPAVVVE